MDRNLGKYLFSRFPKNTAKVKDKDISNLDLALRSYNRKKIENLNKNKPLNSSSRSVLLIDANTTKFLLALVFVFLI